MSHTVANIRKKYLSIAIALALTSIISVSMHVFILQYFSAPDLKIDPYINQICGYFIQFGIVIGSLFIYLCSKKYWKNIKLLPRVILFSVLIMVLLEILFRTPIMNIIVGTPWIYQVLTSIPSYLGFLSLSLIICIFTHAASGEKTT